MSTPFPYEVVYDYFAKPLAGSTLAADTWEPRMYAVFAKDGAVAIVEKLPVAPLFTSVKGKSVLGGVIRMMLKQLPPDSCLVLMSESWIKTVDASKAGQHERSKSLEHDPDATEAIAIMLYGPGDAMKAGHLPIGAGRVVRYQPLIPGQAESGGRLSPQPEGDPVAAASAAHAAREAIRKAATTPPPPGDPHVK